jgi:hypothetical protein
MGMEESLRRVATDLQAWFNYLMRRPTELFAGFRIARRSSPTVIRRDSTKISRNFFRDAHYRL